MREKPILLVQITDILKKKAVLIVCSVEKSSPACAGKGLMKG